MEKLFIYSSRLSVKTCLIYVGYLILMDAHYPLHIAEKESAPGTLFLGEIHLPGEIKYVDVPDYSFGFAKFPNSYGTGTYLIPIVRDAASQLDFVIASPSPGLINTYHLYFRDLTIACDLKGTVYLYKICQ